MGCINFIYLIFCSKATVLHYKTIRKQLNTKALKEQAHQVKLTSPERLYRHLDYVYNMYKYASESTHKTSEIR